jgi:hypothetical protein
MTLNEQKELMETLLVINPDATVENLSNLLKACKDKGVEDIHTRQLVRLSAGAKMVAK